MRLFFILLFFALPFSITAQHLPSISEKTKGFQKFEGFLNFYWDDNGGKIWLEVSRIDTEILYQVSLPAGLGSNDIGLDRGQLSDTRIVRFNRTGRKLLMTQPNYDFRAISKDPAEKRAVEQSFAQSTIWGFAIEAESEGHILVDATDFLLRDAVKAGNRLRAARQGNYSLERSRSTIYLPRTKNFPQNTEFETTITLVNTDGETGEYVQAVTPSTEAITLRMHHSFVQLPDSNYSPRRFDARSSFFGISYFDYATPVSEPIDKYFISRHRLQKKNPDAAQSEALKPIIYYLDNGIPEPVRSALLEGAQWWSQAFEAAGYSNAFQVKMLPDSADPMDIRYNMINWIHRSTRGWSYGATVVDPRTGEIIKGNVSLGSLRVRQDYLIAQGLLAPFSDTVPKDDRMLKMSLSRLRQLAAHEVGHTLGLMHNYAASMVNRSSVMDYPPPTVSLSSSGEIDLSNAYATGIGAWDKVSIAWGYQDFPRSADEKMELNKILIAAGKNGLQFISDRDARAPGGLHPAAHLWDNGSDPVEELKVALKVRSKALEQFGEKNIRPGMPMAMLEDVLVPVYLYHRYQTEAVIKIIGGLNYTYALKGDGQLVTAPVTKEQERKALDAVVATIDPSVLLLPEAIAKLIPPRPAGYNYNRELFKKRTGLGFDRLSPAETAADLPLSFLFNAERLNRLVEYQTAYGGLGLDEMLETLITATWKAPRRKGMEAMIQLQTEQILLTYLLAGSVSEENSFLSRSVIQKKLNELKSFIELKKKSGMDAMYQGHLLLAGERMKAPEKARPTFHIAIPPGAPIGCEEDN